MASLSASHAFTFSDVGGGAASNAVPGGRNAPVRSRRRRWGTWRTPRWGRIWSRRRRWGTWRTPRWGRIWSRWPPPRRRRIWPRRPPPRWRGLWPRRRRIWSRWSLRPLSASFQSDLY